MRLRIAGNLKPSKTTSQPYNSVCSRATARWVLLRHSWWPVFSSHSRKPSLVNCWDSNPKGFRAFRFCTNKFESDKVSNFQRLLNWLHSSPLDAVKVQDKINDMIGSFSFCAGPFWFVKHCPSPFSAVLDDIPRVLYYCSSWQNSDFMSWYDNLSTQKNGYQLVCCIRYVFNS